MGSSKQLKSSASIFVEESISAIGEIRELELLIDEYYAYSKGDQRKTPTSQSGDKVHLTDYFNFLECLSGEVTLGGTNLTATTNRTISQIF